MGQCEEYPMATNLVSVPRRHAAAANNDHAFLDHLGAASSDVHIAVAHAGDDDPLGAIVNAGINKVRRRLR
jgi:hypothetical protein